uniref:Cyclic nucleotide-binding domain-containing protein n=1 Tax=Globisporangium ultimum (strain ATCC 200006 / CBS 805.95 / DAOM BR144) TaxID=431595 RepID=K3X008_GLOUD
MFVTPIKVGFSVPRDWGLDHILDAAVDVVFLMEATLNFFTSYEDDTTGEEIKDLVKIRRNYFYGWFVVDAISSFPASIVGTTNEPLNLTKMVKIIQVHRMSNSGLFKTLSERVNRSMNPSMLRMTMLTLVFFISQHFIACAYFFISSYQEEHTSWGPPDEIRASSLLKQYVDAVYFAILVTTANDVAPSTDIEKVFTALMLFIGIVINASIIGSAANLLSNLDKAEIARKNQMDSINDYLRFKKVPLVLQDKIRRYYDYVLNSRLRDPTESLFVDLPDRLKLSLKLNLQEEFIRKVPLFRVCSHAGMIAIIQCLRPVVAMPSEVVIRQGEAANEFYFIKNGQVSIRVLSDTFEIIPLGNLGEGSFFGETSLLTGGEPQSAEVRAESMAELAYLTEADFTTTIDKFPTFFMAVKQISDSRMQTAHNLRKMSKHSSRSVQPAVRKSSFHETAISIVRRGSSVFSLDTRIGMSTTAMARPNMVKRIPKRFSNSGHKPPESFNALYVEHLSLAQARQLSSIRAIEEVAVGSPDDDAIWED